MKLERIKRRSGGDLILEITPLIDVVFLLLIFFMLATTFDDKAAFKIDLPKSTVAKTNSTLKSMQVIIDKDKKIFIIYEEGNKNNQTEVELNNFTNIVSEKINILENKDVVISADKNIDYGFIVEIMSLLKEAGASAINIDTTIKSR